MTLIDIRMSLLEVPQSQLGRIDYRPRVGIKRMSEIKLFSFHFMNH